MLCISHHSGNNQRLKIELEMHDIAHHLASGLMYACSVTVKSKVVCLFFFLF